jgi:hypothetical protein
VTRCVIDWPAFGLDDPGDTGCVRRPIFKIRQACVHEHIAQAKLCYACLAEVLSYDNPADWTCGPCVTAGHACPAPLMISELVP